MAIMRLRSMGGELELVDQSVSHLKMMRASMYPKMLSIKRT